MSFSRLLPRCAGKWCKSIKPGKATRQTTSKEVSVPQASSCLSQEIDDVTEFSVIQDASHVVSICNMDDGEETHIITNGDVSITRKISSVWMEKSLRDIRQIYQIPIGFVNDRILTKEELPSMINEPYVVHPQEVLPVMDMPSAILHSQRTVPFMENKSTITKETLWYGKPILNRMIRGTMGFEVGLNEENLEKQTDLRIEHIEFEEMRRCDLPLELAAEKTINVREQDRANCLNPLYASTCPQDGGKKKVRKNKNKSSGLSLLKYFRSAFCKQKE